MAGHSKWASIKHKKAATDAKRGKLFTKLARAITVAAREGGGDPAGNHTLAAAIEKAKGYSMPKDNIQRAIDRGTGEGDAGAIERVVYEGYGPGGAAVLVDALTDNRNRTGAEVRNIFDKQGGSLGEPGSVAWQFEKKGVVMVDGARYGEDDLMAAIDAGAEDVAAEDDALKVTSEPAEPDGGSRGARGQPGVEVESAELAMEPKTVVEVTEPGEARRLVRLIDALDDHDDVDEVHANFDIPAELLEEARSRLATPRTLGEASGPVARISTRGGSYGHRPGRRQHGLWRGPGCRRRDERRGRRRDRGARGPRARGTPRADPRGAQRADRLARAGRGRARGALLRQERALRPRRRARPAASRCWPPPSAASPASTTRPRP